MSDRLNSIAKMAPNSENTDQSTDFSFVKDSISELLRSRKVLSSSYAYGYFLKDCGYNKTIFEYLQNELEVSVESLSGLVGRQYLRGSKSRIVQTTQIVAGRRQRFLLCIMRGLLPPETPPGLRKSRKRGLPAILGLDKDDDDWSKSGLPKIDDYDPLKPWIRDARGRHHNLLAILDWPEEDSDEEESSDMSHSKSLVSTTPETACSRPGCGKKRAQNPRTGEFHRYCSLRCQYHDSGATEAALRFACGQSVTASSSGRRKYNVDLMIALQMSRLQLLQDLRKLSRDQDDSATPRSSRFSVDDQLDEDDEDADLQLAIERSVLDIAHSSAPNLTFEGPCCSTYNPIVPATDSGKCRSNLFGGFSEDKNQVQQDDINPRILDSYFRNMVSKKSASSVNDDVNFLKNNDVTLVAEMDKVSKALIKPEFAIAKSSSVANDESETRKDGTSSSNECSTVEGNIIVMNIEPSQSCD